MRKIEKRGESSYRLTVSCGYDKKGKQILKYKTVDLSHIKPNKQQEEAEKQYILFKDELEKGTYLDGGKMSFEEFIDKWLKDYAEPTLAPKTLHEYKIIIKRIKAALGHVKLNKLQPNHLVEFYNNLREDGIRKDGKPGGLSERTILHYHRLISSMLTCAVQWQLILISPASRVKAPKAERKEAKNFSIDQTEYILELLEDQPLKYKTMITLAIYGGMRMGELAALEWNDVDMKSCTLNINKSLQNIPGQKTFVKNTKNKSSDRPISIPKSIIILLKEYKVCQNGVKADMGDLWHESDYLFTAFNGNTIFPNTISKWFLKFLRNHNKAIETDPEIPENDKSKYMLPEINFHGLRHYVEPYIMVSELYFP